MKKINRIVDNRDFSSTIKTGHFEKNNTYRVYWLENSLGYTRIGIAASTKMGNAVIRSTIRRRLRAISDSLLDYSACSLDIVIMPKNLFLEQNYQTNLVELENIFNKFVRTKK